MKTKASCPARVAQPHYSKALANLASDPWLQYVLSKDPCGELATKMRKMIGEDWKFVQHGSCRITSIRQVRNLIPVPFLGRREKSIKAVVMKARAEEIGLNFSQPDAEFVLKHQKNIPKKLRGYYLMFPGTVRRDLYDNRSIPYLHWLYTRWCFGLWAFNDHDNWGGNMCLVCVFKPRRRTN